MENNDILVKLQENYHHNQSIANQIIKAVQQQKGHIVIGVSAEGLHFYKMDNVAKNILSIKGLNCNS